MPQLTKKFWKHIVFLVLIAILNSYLFLNFQLSLAENTINPPPAPENPTNPILTRLQNRLRHTENFYQKLEEKIFKTKERITYLDTELTTLDEQLSNLKTQIALTEKKILEIQKQIATSEHKINELLQEIEIKELEMKDQRRVITEYLQLIYYHKNQYYEAKPQVNQLNPLKVVLGENYLSDTLKKETYLKLLEDVGSDIFEKLGLIKIGMEKKKRQVEVERIRLLQLNKSLEEERSTLEIQKQGKETLIVQTQGQKEVFQEMLLQTLDQQQEAQAEIQALYKNISYFNDKLANSPVELSPEQYEEVLKIREEFQADNPDSNAARYLFPIWPIPPTSISAYFDDPSYEKVFRVKHNAIDLPIRHGSPILAPEKGLVVKTKDNGYGYSYIVLAHRHNIATLYGHVSQILVREGEFVNVGQLMGFSGGTPGTLGAGVRTTGPHLHFQVMYQGQNVDPLDYLRLEALPIEYIPVDKLKKYGLDIVEEITQTIALPAMQPEEEKIELPAQEETLYEETPN